MLLSILQSKSSQVRLLGFGTILAIIGLLAIRHVGSRIVSIGLPAESVNLVATNPRIAKVTMLYGRSNELYERAVMSHERHARMHGYQMHILRHEITGGYWNKPSYLLSLVVQELAKPPGERAQWLMYILKNTDLGGWMQILLLSTR
jgi:hypothetical protein